VTARLSQLVVHAVLASIYPSSYTVGTWQTEEWYLTSLVCVDMRSRQVPASVVGFRGRMPGPRSNMPPFTHSGVFTTSPRATTYCRASVSGCQEQEGAEEGGDPAVRLIRPNNALCWHQAAWKFLACPQTLPGWPSPSGTLLAARPHNQPTSCLHCFPCPACQPGMHMTSTKAAASGCPAPTHTHRTPLRPHPQHPCKHTEM